MDMKENDLSLPFIALTETWLKSYIHDSQLEITNYNLFRSDRSTRVGGGVLLYTHEKLPITNVELYDDQICQAIICTCDTSKMIISVLYRPPEADENSFKYCLDFISNYTKAVGAEYELFLLGDFNLPIIDWSSKGILPGGTISSQNSAIHLLDFMSNNLSIQHILKPTRGQNILDLCISNSSESISHISVSDTDLSDHRLIEIYMSHNPCHMIISNPPDFNKSSFRCLDFNKADYCLINNLLKSVDWMILKEDCDPEYFPQLFTLVVLQICEIGCPKKIPPTKKKNSCIRALARKKRKLCILLEKLKASPRIPSSQLQSLERKLALAHIKIRDAINNDLIYKEQKAVDKVKSNPKYFYSYAKKFSKKKNNISMLFDKNDNLHVNVRDIANMLQDHFTSVFSDPSKTNMESASFNPPVCNYPFTDNMLEFVVNDIIEAIEKMNSNAASGPDEIPVCLLKNCKESLAYPIHMIWSSSFETGIVPDFYKFSNVAPLYKKGSHTSPENYRPISLTSHIIKIFERILRKKIIQYLEVNNIICTNQHGFQTGSSCLTQLLHHFDDVIESLGNHCDFDSIYLDYAKAFDKVDHKLLLKKLHLYKLHPKIIKWIQSFLMDRSQTVVINGHSSYSSKILSGVPQGTVLGPILFLIFINDMELCINHSIIRCFADDTRISKSIISQSDVSLLQDDLNNIIEWSNKNNMSLHKDKFEYVCQKYNKNNTLSELPFFSEYFTYNVSDEIFLTPINQVRDLGVLVSSNMSWSPHIKSIADKARQKAAWVLSVFHTRSSSIMLSLYKSMIRSILEYCCPLWNPTKISDIQELENVQNVFTSHIFEMKEVDYWLRLKHLSLMSLQRRRERYIILHMWKILHHHTRNDLNIQFSLRPRFGYQAIVPHIRNCSRAIQTIYDSSFAVIGPKLWNTIPYILNTNTDFNSFKNRISKFLLSIPDKPPLRGHTSVNSNSIMDWRMDREASALWGGCEMQWSC